VISSETLILPVTKVGKATDSFKVVSSYLNGAGFDASLGVSCYHIFSFAYVDDYSTSLLASSGN
jgi:hypothetical protein